MANGQAITGAQGTLVGIGGDGNAAMTGAATTSAAGTATLNRLLPLRSRKVGGGTATAVLGGQASSGGTGIIAFVKGYALAGQALIGAQGTVLYRGRVTINWNAVTTNQDGTPLTDLAGYRVYHGTTNGGPYPDVQDVGGVLTYQWNGLLPGLTHYFVIRAYDTSNNESANSNQVSKVY